MAAAADQKHGIKRKADDSADTTRAVKYKSPDRFPMSEFNVCLFSCLAKRYLAVKETVKNCTVELLETYGTWTHPVDASKMTFRAWAFRFEALRVLRDISELSCENLSDLPGNFHCARGRGTDALRICLDYVDTLVTLREKMAIGYAMITARFNSVFRFEIEQGYKRSTDTLPVAVPDITRHWASPILAHVKYVEPNSFRCAKYGFWKHSNKAPDMYQGSEKNEHVWLYGMDGVAESAEISGLVDEFPISSVFDGFVTIPGTGVKAPAPGAFPGVHKDLAEIAKSVAPNRLPAWKLAKAHETERRIHGRGREFVTTLDPEYCQTLSQEAIDWADSILVRNSDSDHD